MNMKIMKIGIVLMMALIVGGYVSSAAPATSDGNEGYLSPAALVPSPDGKILYIACKTANQIAWFDISSGKITRTVSTPEAPNGLALSKDGSRLYVSCGSVPGALCVVDTQAAKISSTISLPHIVEAPLLSPDEKTLYLCHRFLNEILVIDVASKKVTGRVAVGREPVALALTPDGSTLFVADHLHSGRADADVVASEVTIVDTRRRAVAGTIALPNGSGILNDIRIAPNGKIAAVSHTLSRFHLPTTQLERGWMNTSAISLLDVQRKKLINTVLVDSVDSGAAYPWGLAWSADSSLLCVAHAGTHEVSVIEINPLLEKLAKLPESLTNTATVDYTAASRVASDVPNDLSFLVGMRERIRFNSNLYYRPENAATNDYGPRALALIGQTLYAGNYFSDTLCKIDLAAKHRAPVSIPLQPRRPMSQLRLGEFFFNDASICFQGWQSCASCHSHDARVDAMNWDLLNDGIGNPKNSKSLLLAHKTPPAMSQGVRDTAETAVRSGIRYILFTVQPESVPQAIDAWLKSLKPVPSPYLENGKLSKAAQRGAKLFDSTRVGCAGCHPAPLFTNLRTYDVGTRGAFDRTSEFDTPTLIEVWRTAPYLHDGSVVTIKELLTTRNREDKHGKTSHLTPQEIEDLAAYVLSL